MKPIRLVRAACAPNLPVGRLGGSLVLATVALMCAAVLLPTLAPSFPPWPGAAAAFGLLLVAALVSRRPVVVHLALLACLTAAWRAVWPPFYPLFLLGPLAVYAILAAALPGLRRTTSWLRRGRFEAGTWMLVALTALASGVALVAWLHYARPDLSHWLTFLPPDPLKLALAGLGFALVNAAVEEAIFRGVLLEALDGVFGAGHLSVLLQALPFGLIHLAGVPGGWLGVALATSYGWLLGLIRRRSGGLLAPVLAHVCADAVIFGMLVAWGG